jgi:glutathione peroxidase
MNIYDIKVKNIKGEDISLSKYQGKVLLVVNTASECMYTPQYEGLEDLYQKYKSKGFEVLDFPCNTFGGQAPGTNEEQAEFCQTRYGTTFETFAKILVNGFHAHPLYIRMKRLERKHFLDEAKTTFSKMIRFCELRFKPARIRWNFTKFLINRNGEVVVRFSPKIKPEQMDNQIRQLLKVKTK